MKTTCLELHIAHKQNLASNAKYLRENMERRELFLRSVFLAGRVTKPDEVKKEKV